MTASSHRLEVPRVARIGSISLFFWALLAAFIWEWILIYIWLYVGPQEMNAKCRKLSN
jgi:hypothetical protein